MAQRALKPCSRPGCSELVATGRCPQHAATVDGQRGTAADRGYDTRWQRERKRFIAEKFAAGVVCCECGCGFYLPNTQVEVDHRIPHRGDPQLFWDRANWQLLTKRCHSRKTALEDGGLGNHSAPRLRGSL